MPVSYRKPCKLSILAHHSGVFQKEVNFSPALHRKVRRSQRDSALPVAPVSHALANAAVKYERGDADLRRDRRHRPQSTLHDSTVTAGNPREDKAIAAGRRLGKRLEKGVVYFDGRAELWPEPMKVLAFGKLR